MSEHQGNQTPSEKMELYDLKSIASATDCTGLIPAAIEDEVEAQAMRLPRLKSGQTKKSRPNK